ncbi:MAG: hypothetical protein ACFHWX_03185 [Bacteroidota bacterium]
MPYFLNISFDGKIHKKIALKHLQFSAIWILGTCIILFRLDVIILNSIGITITWLEGTLPLLLLAVTTLLIFTQKWYFSLAFILYPILAIGWFIPKMILKRGKVYLLFSYINGIYDHIKMIRRTLFHIFIFILALMLLLILGSIWSRILAIIIFSYLYLFYAFRYIVKSFKPAKLFGYSVEKIINNLMDDSKKEKSDFLDRLAKPSASEASLPPEQRLQEQALRLTMLDFTIDYASKQLNGFRGKRAYVISMIFSISLFLLFSIIFFWFINFQLFIIDPTNFQTAIDVTQFDFLYYTFKTITFSDIDRIVPNSTLSRIIEMISFFSLGVIIIVVLLSIIFGLRKEKINDNLQLTKELCSLENKRIREYAMRELNLDIQVARIEIQKIRVSIETLRRILEKIF